ncbi:MAG: anion permease, partial [Bdellovibrionales bacterium]|nr:anion permease [Bdellovibrionales bacterium]
VHPIKVTPSSACIGMSVRDTRMGELLGVRVFGLLRNGELELTFDGHQIIEDHDKLLVIGAPKSIEALDELSRLEIESEQSESSLESKEVGLIEVVLSPRSSLIGKTPVEANFREKYGFQVLAVWREGKPYRTQLGSKPLQFGDALLLHGKRKNAALILEEDDLVVLTDLGAVSKKSSQAWNAVAALCIMVALSISRIVPVSFAAFVGALALMVTGTLKMEDAYRNINWRILVLVAAVLPLAPAMQSSGTNEYLSSLLINWIGDLGPTALLLTFCIVASLLSQALDSVVPIVLLSPIVLNAADRLGIQALPFLMGIAFSASIAFLTPFSHKANLLVMAAGGYRIKDYFRVGIFLTLLCFAILISVLPLIFPFTK